MSAHLNKIANKVSHEIGSISSADVDTSVVVGGIISTVKKIITKSGGKEMAFLRLSDLTGSIEVVIFPRLFATAKNNLLVDTVVIIKGKVSEKDERLAVLANDVFVQ